MNSFLIGSNGQLGQALLGVFQNQKVHCVGPSHYLNWQLKGTSDKISQYFSPFANQGATIIIAAGLLNPKLSSNKLALANYYLPKNIIDAVTNLNIKVVTFGTVMEELSNPPNDYVKSKLKLNTLVTNLAAQNKEVVHLQLHTLLGHGQPHPFMFLGQILASLQANTTFKMTSGKQLREYHRVSDIAESVKTIIDRDITGVRNISHGKPLSLRSIAEAVYSYFGKSDLLKIGALPDPINDIYELVIPQTKNLDKISPHITVEDIRKYMEDCYKNG